MRKIYQHLSAPNDVNGNPRRLYVVYSTINGEVLKVYDEGYGGLPGELKTELAMIGVVITVQTYNHIKQVYSTRLARP